MSHGLQFQTSYVLTRDLSDSGGAVPTEFAGAGGNWVSDKNNPRLDYGNVMFDRRHRVLATFLYQLPFGKGATFLANSNRLVDTLVGGWQLGGVTGVPERSVPHHGAGVGGFREYRDSEYAGRGAGRCGSRGQSESDEGTDEFRPGRYLSIRRRSRFRR